MNPSSFQYQPLNIQKNGIRPPTFINPKILDKSAPNLFPTKQFNSLQQNISKEGEISHQANKSTYLPGKQEPGNSSLTPKNFTEKGNNLNNLSSPALKPYFSPQLNKT